VKPSDLLSALLAPAGEPQLPHAAYVGLQALLDAVPIALMEFRLSGERLVLLTANAAARRMPGLGGVREPGADARAVFDQLAGTALIDQLCGVARLGVPLDGRHVLRDGPRLQLAWDIAARRMASDCVLVAVSDVSEAEGLRQALQASEQALAEARRDLREQTEVFDTMETLARAGHWRRIKDPGETVLLWSPGLCEIAGFERQEWLDPEYAMSGILPEDRPLFDAASRAQDGANVEYRWRRPDGEVRWMRSRVQRVRSRDGVSVQMGVVQDVTEEHRAAEQLREQLVFIQRIASRVPGFIYQYRIHRDGSTASVQYISEAVREFLGVAPREVMRDHGLLEQRVLPEDVPQLRRSAMLSVRRLVPWQSEYRVRMPDGSVRWHMTSAVPHRESDGAVVSHGFTMDITERKQAEQQIERLAFYDALTGLPNRRLLLDRLQRSVVLSQRTRQQGALLFIDLDNFKVLNDTLGHDMGDQLLIEVARRLVATVRESDTVARFGGDEFVVMLEHLACDSAEAALQVEGVAEKLLAHVNQPIVLGGRHHYSSPSIGIALFGGERVEVHELLKRADLAMYEAKAAGRNTLRFFDPGMQAAVNARLHLEADMRQGLERGEFSVHYQPVVDERARLVGAEVLLRWRHPVRGMVSPAEFIPLAEQSGLILQLGRFVLQQACAQLARWAQGPATAHLGLSVNVSARQFRHADFVAEVLEALREHAANPRRLTLELTESMLLGNVEDAIARMQQLKREGIGFALDDFGTGYSSLSFLKRLPLEQIKIDQGFVRDVLEDPNDAAIVRTILALAQSLDLQVVAEGVETAGQLGFLRLHGCGGFQGYLFGRPAPLQAWDEMLFTAR
jgi:diguanylate cyclase (GGDEF)-like protein/PAS domain S-box-containing protein